MTHYIRHYEYSCSSCNYRITTSIPWPYYVRNKKKIPYEDSLAHPNAVLGSLIAAQERWNIPVYFLDNFSLYRGICREYAEQTSRLYMAGEEWF